MAERSSSGKADLTTKAPRTKGKAGGGQSAQGGGPDKPQGGGGDVLGGWRMWTAVGALLVAGVVAWKLAGSTYRSDVETMCQGEKGSGYTIEGDQPKVIQWVRDHLSTPEGNELFSTLVDQAAADRAKKLRAAADSQHLRACPMVAAYEKLAAEGQYRADLQRICSDLTFPKLDEQDHAERLARIVDWIDHAAKSPRTRELEAPLKAAATPAERANLLRKVAGEMDVFSCNTAKTIEGPQLPPRSPRDAMVRVWSTPQITGPLKEEDLAKAVARITPAMNECYRKGLEKKSDIEGKLALKLDVDPQGRVSKVAPEAPDKNLVDADPRLLSCLIKAAKSMVLPANPGPLASVFLPLELTMDGPMSTVAPPSVRAAPVITPLPATATRGSLPSLPLGVGGR